MLKRLSTFFDTAPMWEIYVFFLVVFTAAFFLFGSLFTNNFNHTSMLQISLCMSLLVSIFGTVSAYTDRKNHKFWHMANELETRVGQADEPDVLLDLFNEEFQELKGVAFNNRHRSEVKRLYITIETKFEIVREKIRA